MLNREMLKQQTIPVGDVDTIANAIDRQKVKSSLIPAHYIDRSSFPSFPFNFA